MNPRIKKRIKKKKNLGKLGLELRVLALRFGRRRLR